MKKIFVFVILLLGLQMFAAAQVTTVHIAGLVLSDSTGLPVANHDVTITADSNNTAGFNFYALRTTNASGSFDCNVLNVPTSTTIEFHIRTFDCMNQMHEVVVYSPNTPITVTFSICTQVIPTCQAAFTFTPDPVNILHVHFLDTSVPTGQIATRLWDFGDGHTATTGDPWNTFASAGVYHVCLTIMTTTGCSSTICHEITVGNNVPGCQAAFTYNNDSLHPLVYHFLDQSLGSPIAWHWSFGDGITSTAQNPEHVYSVAGYYNVCLLIEGDSCHSTICDTLYIGVNPHPCENWFTYTKNLLTVAFEAHTTNDLATEYTWTMGDQAGSVLHGKNITFTYPAPGTYAVTLTTVDANSCTFISTQSVEVTNFSFLQGTIYAGDNQADHGFVELIRKDSTNIMTVVDSHEFGDSLGMYFFEQVLPGHYYLKATLNPTSVYYGQFAPTYHNDALNWTTAQLVELGTPVNPYDIHMKHVTAYSPGSGNISGTVTQGGKLNGNGIGVQGVEILLLDESNQPLAYTVSDANGHFAFANVGIGSYIVYPEILGKTTVPANITLDNSNLAPVVSFTVNSASVVYGINDLTVKYFSSISEIIPNPVTEATTLQMNAKNEVHISLVISDVNGKKVREIQSIIHSGENTLKLQLQNISSGTYYLGIIVDGKTVALRRFIKK